MRERRKLVAVSTGRVELEALNAPENGEVQGGCGALPHAPAGRSSPCTPGTSDGRAQEATGEAQATGKAAQEIQEMQEIQERPVGATDVISASGEAAAVPTSPTNTAGRFDVGTAVPSWAEGAEGQGNSQASGGEAAKVVYSDWGVCGALGWRRRRLVGLRRGLVRGVDWWGCWGLGASGGGLTWPGWRVRVVRVW